MSEYQCKYESLSAKMPGVLLLMRLGDFYETFGPSAEKMSAVLGLTLSRSRTTGVPMAGIPYHCLERYLQKLIDAGYRVAVADNESGKGEWVSHSQWRSAPIGGAA